MRPRDPVFGVLAAIAAFGVMAGTSLLAVRSLGLPGGATWAAFALATGGSVRIEASFARELPFRLDGDLDLMPLGVTVLGAVVLLAVLLAGRPAGVPSLLVRAGAAAVAFLALLAIPLSSAAVDAGSFVLRPATGATVFGTVVWLLAVFAIGGLWHLRGPARSAVRATIAVLLGTTAVAMAAGLLAAVQGGAKVAGTVLLAGPNLVVIGLTRGLGVPWSAGAIDGPGPLAGLAGRLPAEMTAGIDAGRLDALREMNLWPLSVVAVALVLLCAVFAMRGRHPVDAVWLGLALAVAFPVLTALAGVSVRFGVGFAGRSLADLGFGTTGQIVFAVPIGLAAGLLASLLVAWAKNWQGLSGSGSLRGRWR